MKLQLSKQPHLLHGRNHGKRKLIIENDETEDIHYYALTNAQRRIYKKYIEKNGIVFEDINDNEIPFQGIIKDVLMYRDDEIEGVCFAYNVMNNVEDGLQYIFVESLINSPHVIWFNSSADNTNDNAMESNQRICCSTDHKRKTGWRGYAEIPVDSLPVPLSVQFEELTTQKNNGNRKLRSCNDI